MSDPRAAQDATASAAHEPAGVLDRRLVNVTGKGGTGKTTVAAALGVAVAVSGRRALACELNGDRRLQRAFRAPGDGAAEVRLRPRLWFASIDPREALVERPRRQPGGPVAAAVLGHSTGFAHFVAAAPGRRSS